MAVASSSKNANGMMRLIHLDSGQNLLDVFSANVCGRDLPRGKPDPAIFLLAAAELHIDPTSLFRGRRRPRRHPGRPRRQHDGAWCCPA